MIELFISLKLHFPALKIQFGKLSIALLTILLYASFGHCQSLIKGSVYGYDTNEEIIGYFVIIDNIKIDSAIVLGNLDGDFKIQTNTKEKFDIHIICCASRMEYTGNKILKTDTFDIRNIGYYTTVIKNVLLNNDTINLGSIPLFQYESRTYETIRITKKHLWGLFKTYTWESGLFGYQGPFSHKSIFYLKYDKDIQNLIPFELKGEIVYLDYENIKNVW